MAEGFVESEIAYAQRDEVGGLGKKKKVIKNEWLKEENSEAYSGIFFSFSHA